MINLTDLKRLRRILCIGAHSDDVEIGCGGTILHILDQNPSVEVLWCVFSASGLRAHEALRGADLFLERARDRRVVLHEFADARFSDSAATIKGHFEAFKQFDPELIFTHRVEDAHQDHRLLGQLTFQTFRSQLVLQYEIPKFDGDLGHPNVYVTISADELARKCRYLQEAFATQQSKHWFDPDTFRGLARIRGLECASPTRFAEGFYCRKWSIE
jgi:LmbE family N-acetylglucosaminyl deacetylase